MTPATLVGWRGMPRLVRGIPRIAPIWLGLLIHSFICGQASAQLDLKAYQTEDMIVVYMDDDNSYILPHLTRCFQNSLGFHEMLFDYQPSEEVTVLLQDFDDYGYAGATPIPSNYLTIGIEPFEYVYETSPTNERINWVMSHELLHIVASDQAAPRDRKWRKFFGGKVVPDPEQPLSMLFAYLTTPRLYAPRWYHEGMAVFFETWMAGGYGRALGGYDEMVFRTMVENGAYFYDTVGLESEGKAIDFQVGQVSYLYGTRFVSFLAHQHGPQSLVEWLKRGPESRASYRSQFKQVYGTDLDSEWQRWIEWEHRWQEENLERIAAYPVTEFRALSDRPLGSASRAYYDRVRRRLVTAVNYPGEFAHIATVNPESWEVRKVTEIATPALYYVTALAYDPDTGTAFFTTQNSKQWRDLNAVDIDSGEARVLIKNIRTGDLVFNRSDRSLWGVQHHNGLSRLVRIEPPHTEWDHITTVLTLPYGKDIFDIDISPDGAWLTASMIEVSGRQRLIRMSIEALLAGDSSYEVLYEFADNSPANFVFSPDGRFLYGTSYYTGVSNVFRYDFASGEMDALTNALTGFFRPVPMTDDEMIAFHYTADGFVPARVQVAVVDDIEPARYLGQEIVTTHPMVTEWMLPPPSAVDLEALDPQSEPYRATRRLGFSSWYPVVEKYRDWAAAGARFNFMDPLGFASVDVTASVTPQGDVPDDERFHLTARYRRWPWTVSAYYNPADFYDFFGPTKRSRKGYGAVGEFAGVIINDRPRSLDYALTLAAFSGLDELPQYQGIPATLSEYVEASGRLEYAAHRKTIGGLGPEKGISWRLFGTDKLAEGDHYPRVWGDFNWIVPLPLEHSSIWIRPGGGYSWGDRDNTLSNFYFGGFGNNWVDWREVRRYREYYALPGLDISELEANNYGKLLVEWNLPPLRFKRAGSADVYLTWMSAALFATGIVTDLDDSALRREVWDVGAQIDFKLVLFSNMSTTFSIGIARAWDDTGAGQNEVMLSLKIL